MRAAAALLLAGALGGCGSLDREAVILMVDPDYRAEILLDNQDGISAPDGLLWSNGQLYIADEGGSAVRRWAHGQRVATLATAAAGLSSPEDLALAPDGRLFVSDDDTGGVWEIAPGRQARRIAPSVTSSEGVVLARDGTMLVGDPTRRRVLALTTDGRPYPFLSQAIAKAESFAFDGKGNLYIADNRDRRLYLRTPDGALHVPLANRGGFSPESLHYGQSGLFITDSENGKLRLFTPEDGLRTIAVFGGSLANVQGITGDERGNLYVSVQSDLEADKGYIVRLRRR
jgi:glucose/arabinose dehydrogenase